MNRHLTTKIRITNVIDEKYSRALIDVIVQQFIGPPVDGHRWRITIGSLMSLGHQYNAAIDPDLTQQLYGVIDGSVTIADSRRHYYMVEQVKLYLRRLMPAIQAKLAAEAVHRMTWAESLLSAHSVVLSILSLRLAPEIDREAV